jgi:hypothetical protein
MRSSILGLLTLSALGVPAIAQTARGTARQAASTVPPALRAALKRDGCQVPSPPSEVYTRDSSAAISYVAYRAAVRSLQLDWVILCERGGHREFRVYSDPVRRGSRPVLQRAVEWDPKAEGCEGWIRIADSAWVRDAFANQPANTAVSLSPHERAFPLHSAILDSLCEGDGAHLRYWTGRRWITLRALWDVP